MNKEDKKDIAFLILVVCVLIVNFYWIFHPEIKQDAYLLGLVRGIVHTSSIYIFIRLLITRIL
jgi:hypothetical protein